MGLIPCVVAGCGPGSALWVTPQVRAAASACDLLAGPARLVDLFPESPAQRLAWEGGMDAFLEALAPHLGREAVTVLVTGDPGLASFAGTLARRFPSQPFRRLPGLSSVQVAFAEADLDHLEARVIRAHGAVPPWDPAWEVHRGPFAILAGAEGAGTLAVDLALRLNRPAIWCCENLGLPSQRVRRLAPEALGPFAPLSVLIVEGERP
jgi:cobalt-precorrin-7 (C5)-methyltransferase